MADLTPRPFDKLTTRQQAILAFIQACHDEGEPPPTVREIMDVTGISSTSVVNYNLDALEAAGLITRRSEKARGIRLAGAEGPSGPNQPKGLAEVVRVHQVQINDLRQEVQRLRRIVEALQ